MVRTAVLVSGNGTNLQSIINAFNFGRIKNCELAAVIFIPAGRLRAGAR